MKRWLLLLILCLIPAAYATLDNPYNVYHFDYAFNETFLQHPTPSESVSTNHTVYPDATGNLNLYSLNFNQSPFPPAPLRFPNINTIIFKIGNASVNKTNDGNEMLQITSFNNNTLLPVNVTVPTTISIAAWVNISGSASSWQVLIFDTRLDTGDKKQVNFYIRNNLTLVFEFNNGSTTGGSTWQTTNGIVPYKEWAHIGVTFTLDGTPTFYINGIAYAASNGSPINYSNSQKRYPAGYVTNMFVASAVTVSGGIGVNQLDEMSIWHKILTPSDMLSLYNSGNGQAYPYTSAGLILQLNNTVNGSLYQNFCVNITGGSTSYNCTTTSSLTYDNLTGNLTILFLNGTYFNYTASANLTNLSNMTVIGQSYDALINLTVRRLWANTTIASYNATNNKVFNSTSSTNLLIPANLGINNLLIQVLGNFSINTTCNVLLNYSTLPCSAEGIYDSLFTVNASFAGGGAISDFDLTVTNTSINTAFSGSTTNGTIQVPLLQGYFYQFLITLASGTSSATLPINSTSSSYSFSSGTLTNSIYMSFFYELNGTLFTHNVSVHFDNGTYSFFNTTTSGSMVAAGLTPGLWTITASSTGYGDRQYFALVTPSSTQALNIYLLNNDNATQVVFTVKDQSTTSIITNATVTMQANINNSFVTIDQHLSDIFGVARFDLVNGQTYHVIVNKTGYQLKTGDFVVTTSSYIIILTPSTGTNFSTYSDDVSYTILPITVNATVTDFSITTISNSNALSWFAVVVNLNGTNTTTNVTTSPGGNTATVTLDLTGFEGYPVLAWYYIQSNNFNNTLVIPKSWIIPGYTPGNLTLDDFMTHYADNDNGLSPISRGIILTIGAVLLGGLIGFIFGGTMAAITASAVYLVGAWYGWIDPIIIGIIVAGLFFAILLKGGR